MSEEAAGVAADLEARLRQAEAQRDDAMRQRDDTMHQRDAVMRQRDELMQARDGLLAERDALIDERNSLMVERDRILTQVAGSAAAAIHSPEGAYADLPAIFLNTLPKSASVYTIETMAATVGKPLMTISAGYFPEDQLDFHQLDVLIRRRAACQSHLDASPRNLRYLKKLERFVVTLRDPRQATLSWFHHLDRMRQDGATDLLLAVEPVLPPDYFDRPFEARLDYQIDHYLPLTVRWMMDWIAVSTNTEFRDRILISSYEALMANEDACFAALLRFYGAAIPTQHLAKVKPTRERNFRAGRTDEWRDVFTASQQARACEAVPPALIDRIAETVRVLSS